MNRGKRKIMTTTQKETINSESGFALVTALIILSVLTLIGIAANTTSTTELQIAGNERQYLETFYNTEGILINTMETSNIWLTTGFLTTGETTASYSAASKNTTVEIRCIESTNTPVSGLGDDANDFPVLPHKDTPPSKSGYGMKSFEVRRYVITITSASGARIQTGVWKAFNKS